jgi:hypothetical protein
MRPSCWDDKSTVSKSWAFCALCVLAFKLELLTHLPQFPPRPLHIRIRVILRERSLLVRRSILPEAVESANKLLVINSFRR